jgi:hypothetical protein
MEETGDELTFDCHVVRLTSLKGSINRLEASVENCCTSPSSERVYGNKWAIVLPIIELGLSGDDIACTCKSDFHSISERRIVGFKNARVPRIVVVHVTELVGVLDSLRK